MSRVSVSLDRTEALGRNTMYRQNVSGSGKELGKAYINFARNSMDQIRQKVNDELWILNLFESNVRPHGCKQKRPQPSCPTCPTGPPHPVDLCCRKNNIVLRIHPSCRPTLPTGPPQPFDSLLS
ncbi:Calcium-dependent secretion activator [Portunus trituberculatus]|uniref:Calcium-dependent secretion activator n=1 Tax=Portunus trituberculatus TaxID=210409 RepID=A0A5B7FU17_PORTR|nr:Calcium-dependent secretion activator [Portunus trituberculatus]